MGDLDEVRGTRLMLCTAQITYAAAETASQASDVTKASGAARQVLQPFEKCTLQIAWL